jgi:hypothetical protein
VTGIVGSDMETRRPQVGAPKTYDVGGLTVDGRVMPAGTRMRLSDADAERAGLKKRPEPERTTGEPDAKPAPADNKARPAPSPRRRV